MIGKIAIQPFNHSTIQLFNHNQHMFNDSFTPDESDDIAGEIVSRDERIKRINDANLTSGDLQLDPKRVLPILEEFAKILLPISVEEIKSLVDQGQIDIGNFFVLSTAIVTQKIPIKKYPGLYEKVVRILKEKT